MLSPIHASMASVAFFIAFTFGGCSIACANSTSTTGPVAGTVLKANSGSQATIDIGFEAGIEVGHLLHVQRAGKTLGLLEVVETFHQTSRCHTDQALIAGDQVQLGTLTDLRGKCTSDSGAPLVNVEVRVFRTSNNYIDEPKLLVSTRTTSNGDYALNGVYAIELAHYGTDLLLVIQKRGFVSIVAPVTSLENDKDFELSDQVGTLVGIVLDPDGNRLPNAHVSLPGRYSRIPGAQSAITDDKGKFLIRDLAVWNPPEGHRRPVWITHTDFANTMIMFSKVPSVLNARLAPPAIIEGSVIDGVTGEPLANALVSAQGVNEMGWYQVRSDENGQYRLLMTADRYNIWAHVNGRIPIAIDSIEAIPGKSKLGADIRMVEGGVVYGKYVDSEGKPVDVLGRVSVAHYGPARPRSGAAVISTPMAADGSYRLRVAPGKNYIYVMSGGSSGNIEIADGQEIELNLTAGVRGNMPKNAIPMIKLQNAIEVKENDGFQPSRNRGNTPAGLLLDRLEQMNSGDQRFDEPWLLLLKQITDLGSKAVPELCKELDETDNDMMMRCMGFVLRAMNDKRAGPALIRAIPKTLRKPGSDMGLRVEDAELQVFAHKNDLGRDNQAGQYGFGRPVREILGALQQLAGHAIDDDQLYSIFLQGTEQQLAMKQKLFERHAMKWSSWWEENAEALEIPDEFRLVHLPKFEKVVSVPAVQLQTPYNTVSGGSNWILESALNPKSQRVFYDFDTGRVSSLPDRWRESLPDANAQQAELAELPMDQIEAWAAEEGFDIMGTQVATGNDDERVYALRLLGMQAWQLKDELWKTRPEDITLEELIQEGRKAALYLFHEGPNLIDHEKHAPFVVITREGTPALVYLGIQVLDDSLQPGGIVNGDNELNPVAFHKGRRFAFNFFEAIP